MAPLTFCTTLTLTQVAKRSSKSARIQRNNLLSLAQCLRQSKTVSRVVHVNKSAKVVAACANVLVFSSMNRQTSITPNYPSCREDQSKFCTVIRSASFTAKLAMRNKTATMITTPRSSRTRMDIFILSQG